MNSTDSRFSGYAYRHFLFWCVISSLGVTVSTLIDAVLVGNIVGSTGLAAVNIATPVFLFFALFGITVGTGASVLIGRSLGSADTDEANRTFNTGLTVGFIFGVIIALFSLVFRNDLISLLGARGELVLPAESYLTVVFASAPIFIVYQIINAAVRTDGDPGRSSVSSVVVIVTDLTLDILFMKILHFGIFGASLSLCIAELLGSVILIPHFFRKDSLLSFRIRLLSKNDLDTVKAVISGGFSVGSAAFFQAVYTVIFNRLLSLSDNGVLNIALFAIFYTMSTVAAALYEGSSNAMSPLVSIFTGEKDITNVISSLRYALISAISSGTVISVLFIVFAEPIIRFFGIDDAAYIPIAVRSFRLFSVSLVISGISTVVISFWQAIERTKHANILSLLQSLFFTTAIGSILIIKLDITGLGLSYIITAVGCLIVIVFVSLFFNSKNYLKTICAPASRVFEKSYVINTENMESIAGDICSVCEEWEISPKNSFFLNLVVEELILNIMRLGMKDDRKNKYVAIKILENGNEYAVRVRDNVNSYNPFESDGDEIDNAVINMIKLKTKYYSYQRKLVFNYLYFVI